MTAQYEIMNRLVVVENRILRQISSVHGFLTNTDIEDVAAARKAAGMRYDPVNQKFTPLEDDD